MVSKDELISIARQVREKSVSDPLGQCFPASKELKKELISETKANKDEIDVEEVRVGEYGTIRHYVVSFPARYISDSSSGSVLIDITLDQYCDAFKSQDFVEFSLGEKESIPQAVLFESRIEAPYS